MPYGGSTNGVQVKAACLTPDDRLKVIDLDADDTTNAIAISRFFQLTAGVAVIERTADATVIQTPAAIWVTANMFAPLRPKPWPRRTCWTSCHRITSSPRC